MIIIELLGFGFRSDEIEGRIRDIITKSDFPYKDQIRIASCVCTGTTCINLQGKDAPVIKIVGGGGEVAGEIKQQLRRILKNSELLQSYL